MTNDRSDPFVARADQPSGPTAPEPRPGPDDPPPVGSPPGSPFPSPHRDDDEAPRHMPDRAPGIHSDKPWTRA